MTTDLLEDLMGRGFGPIPAHRLRTLRDDFDLPTAYFEFLSRVGVGTVGSVVVWDEPCEASEIVGGPEQDEIWIVGELGDGVFMAYVDDGQSCAFTTFGSEDYPDSVEPGDETLAQTVRDWIR